MLDSGRGKLIINVMQTHCSIQDKSINSHFPVLKGMEWDIQHGSRGDSKLSEDHIRNDKCQPAHGDHRIINVMGTASWLCDLHTLIDNHVAIQKPAQPGHNHECTRGPIRLFHIVYRFSYMHFLSLYYGVVYSLDQKCRSMFHYHR